MKVRARTLSALAAVVLLSVAGCASPPTSPQGQPTATATPTSTPTPTPTATPDAPLARIVVIGPDGLSMRTAEGEEIDVFPYDTAPDAAIADLTRIFDAEPTVEHFPGDQICEPERLEFRWAGMSIHVEKDGPSAATFAAGAREGDTNTEIVVQTQHGGQIGGSLVELVAAIPDPLTPPWDHEGERPGVVMDGLTADPPAGEEREFWPGVRIHAIDDKIFNIYAPVALTSDC